MADINQAEISRIAALGQGKPQGGGDEGGGDNAMMELLMGAMNRVVGMLGKAGVPGTSIANSVMTTGIQSGIESPEGFTGKKFMPAINISGGDGFFFKIFLALKKGGMSIKDLTAGIEPQQAADVSWARLGELASPITPNTGGAGVGMDL